MHLNNVLPSFYFVHFLIYCLHTLKDMKLGALTWHGRQWTTVMFPCLPWLEVPSLQGRPLEQINSLTFAEALSPKRRYPSAVARTLEQRSLPKAGFYASIYIFPFNDVHVCVRAHTHTHTGATQDCLIMHSHTHNVPCLYFNSYFTSVRRQYINVYVICFSDDDTGPMKKWNVKALTALKGELKSKIIVNNGLNDILEKDAGGFMSEAEAQRVESKSSNAEKMEEIIQILKGKSDAHFGTFCQMLRQVEYDVWADALEKKAGENKGASGTHVLQ